MNIDTILIGITLVIVLVGVGFTIHGYIRNKILKRKLKVFYKSHYGPEKKRGFEDYCSDSFGKFLTFLKELDEGVIDKDEVK